MKFSTCEVIGSSPYTSGVLSGRRRLGREAHAGGSCRSTPIRPLATTRNTTSRASRRLVRLRSAPARTIQSARSGLGYQPTVTVSTDRLIHPCQQTESHGCVRLTNCDVQRLAPGLKKGVEVSFFQSKDVAALAANILRSADEQTLR